MQRFKNRTLQTQYFPYARLDEVAVRADQYANGLRIFTGDQVYHFISDSCDYIGGDPTAGTSLDTIPSLTLGQIRELFATDAPKYLIQGQFTDSTCLKAEFGYYNLNAGISYSTEVLVKAWRVTPLNTTWPSEYPVAFYQDKDGKLIYFDNGIRTLQ